MKKIILLFVLIATSVTVNAQTSTRKPITNDDYNKWSIELAGGFNKPLRPMKYFTSTPSPYVVDLGVRYMFNTKFGLKADLGYNSFQGGKKSIDFNTKYYRTDLQAVVNLGRMMDFETWTNTIGLLVHSGFGAAQLEDQNSAIKDKMINFIIGATGQIKLSNKLALTGDFTTILNARQSHTFDAASVNRGKGFSGILFNGTIGLTLYLGKNKKHADWVILIDKDLLALKNKVDSLVDKDILALKNRVDNLENNLLDSDKDGIADYLDQEAGTIPDHMVNSKGKSIDLDNNGIPDELESYLTKTYANRTDNDSQQLTDSESITKLVNGGYVAAYFDFNKSTPTDSSIDGINFILNYLRNNPSASVEIIGHADEIGNALYNEKLSNERANSIKNILLKANIAASRISVVAAGEDTSVDKGSTLARKLARRATFKIKD